MSFLLQFLTNFGSLLLVLELQRHPSAKDGAWPDMFTKDCAQCLCRVYTIVSWSLLRSFGVAALAVLLRLIAFDDIAAALTSLAVVIMAMAICFWLYQCTQG